ncbi:unnamed protein product [Prorocentrum cordatum]|uniref:Uncharacterized protein n=1 Tax=Prorocentrum cordatum TaxID=2364126 RepID=A0ABN9S443_9DINO|nr:unnamed protein product [Polarella glacialis]
MFFCVHENRRGGAPMGEIPGKSSMGIPGGPGGTSGNARHMLEHVLGSLQQVPGLLGAPRVLVCDGLVEAGASRKPQHKAGRVTPDDASRYREFVARVRSLAAEGEGPFADLQVVECTEHQGFGFAVKRALQEVRTAFVLVVQHDQEVVRAFDLPAVLLAMGSHPDRLKYVGLCSTTTRNYEAMVLSKYQPSDSPAPRSSACPWCHCSSSTTSRTSAPPATTARWCSARAPL